MAKLELQTKKMRGRPMGRPDMGRVRDRLPPRYRDHPPHDLGRNGSSPPYERSRPPYDGPPPMRQEMGREPPRRDHYPGEERFPQSNRRGGGPRPSRRSRSPRGPLRKTEPLRFIPPQPIHTPHRETMGRSQQRSEPRRPIPKRSPPPPPKIDRETIHMKRPRETFRESPSPPRRIEENRSIKLPVGYRKAERPEYRGPEENIRLNSTELQAIRVQIHMPGRGNKETPPKRDYDERPYAGSKRGYEEPPLRSEKREFDSPPRVQKRIRSNSPGRGGSKRSGYEGPSTRRPAISPPGRYPREEPGPPRGGRSLSDRFGSTQDQQEYSWNDDIAMHRMRNEGGGGGVRKNFRNSPEPRHLPPQDDRDLEGPRGRGPSRGKPRGFEPREPRPQKRYPPPGGRNFEGADRERFGREPPRYMDQGFPKRNERTWYPGDSDMRPSPF